LASFSVEFSPVCEYSEPDGDVDGFIPMTLAAVAGVPENQSGVASAILNTAQQIGAALGIAVLSTISAATTGNQTTPTALTDGYTTAYLWAAGLMLLAAVAVTSTQRHHDATPVE
jgi:hypothetical protein